MNDPLSLQIYFWFSYSVISVSLILSPIISQALAPFTCAVTVTAQGFPHPSSLPCPEFLEDSFASFFFLLSSHSTILIFEYFHWISKAFKKPFSVICPAALLASPALEVGDKNASPEVFFWTDSQRKLASIAKIVQFIGGAVHTSKTRVKPPAGG